MSEQHDTRVCPQCGAPLGSDAPQGLCPRCLMAKAVETMQSEPGEPGDEPAQAAHTSRHSFTPPTVEELAKHFPQLEIIELLGRGGMGAVYKARQKELDRIVALKILPPGVGDRPAFAERFMREARALARLNHPNIVAVYDFGHTSGPSPQTGGGLYYFLMEYVDGVNLRHVVQNRELDPKQALAIVPQVCEALQFAHDEGIVHRDIKPENILMDKRGRVKIADFGLAKLVQDNPEDVTLTREGTMGTPHYMAPEQLGSAHSVDHRADIYSLGVVFYEMLTGELPLGRFAPPSKRVQVDVRLDEVVLRSLEHEPAMRWQQASEVKTQVDEIRGLSPHAVAGLKRAMGREYKSKATLFGLPLVHIATGIDPKTGKHRVAKGIIAMGDIAVGVFAFGGLAMGGFTFAGVGIGLVSFSGVALALLAAIGGLAVGGFAFGGLAVGVVALGGMAVGYYAGGGTAVGVHAVGSGGGDPHAREFFESWARDWPKWLAIIGMSVPALIGIGWVIISLALRSKESTSGWNGDDDRGGGSSGAGRRDAGKASAGNAVREQVRAPALGLVLVGVLNWLANIGFVVAVFVFGRESLLVEKAEIPHEVLPWFAALFILTSGLMIFGGLKMMHLQSRGTAIAAAVIALFVTPGNIIGLPLGIWALVVLSRPEVRQAFAGSDKAAGGNTPSTPASRVVNPAIGLIVCGIISWVTVPLAFIIPWLDEAANTDASQANILMSFGLAPLVLGTIMTIAGVRMKRLEGYGLAIAAAILPIVVLGVKLVAMATHRTLAMGPADFISAPIGLWVLAVLSRSDVRAAFGGGSPDATAAPPRELHAPFAQGPAPRPLSVPFFGVLNILAGVCLLFLISLSALPVDETDEFERMWREATPGYDTLMIINAVAVPLNYLAAAGLFAAGIGLLMWKPWARKLAIAVCVFMLVDFVIETPVVVFSGLVPMFELAENPQFLEYMELESTEEALRFAGMLIWGLALLTLIGLTYYISQLVVLNRPRVAAAFARSGEPGGAGRDDGSASNDQPPHQGPATSGSVIHATISIVLLFLALIVPGAIYAATDDIHHPSILGSFCGLLVGAALFGVAGRQHLDRGLRVLPIVLLAAGLIARAAFIPPPPPKTMQQYIAEHPDASFWLMTEQGPALNDWFAESLDLAPSQRNQVDAALQRYFQLYREAEARHTGRTIDSHGHQTVSIEPFPNELDALEASLWKDVLPHLPPDDDTTPGSPLETLQINLPLHPKPATPDNERSLYNRGIFGFGRQPFRIEMWKVGEMFYWNVEDEPYYAGTHSDRGKALPAEYARFWIENAVAPAPNARRAAPPAAIEFRIAPLPAYVGASYNPPGTTDHARYKEELAEHGPTALHRRDTHWRWCELLIEPVDTDKKLIVGQWDGRKFLLLSNDPDYALLKGRPAKAPPDTSDGSWSVKEASPQQDPNDPGRFRVRIVLDSTAALHRITWPIRRHRLALVVGGKVLGLIAPPEAIETGQITFEGLTEAEGTRMVEALTDGSLPDDQSR